MKAQSILILSIVLLALVGVYYANKALERAVRPRESAVRLFLFIFANFLLIVVSILSVVAVIVSIFGH